MTATAIQPEREKWTTPKLALTTVLGAIAGVVSTPFSLAWVALNNAFGILGAAAFQPWQLFTTIAGWLIPRPGVYLLAETTRGLVNMLTGDPSGIAVLYWGVAGGLAGEAAGLIYRWNPAKRTQIALLRGVLHIPFTNVVTAFLYGWDPSTWTFWLGALVAVVAITLESTIPGIALAKWLASSGLLRTIGVKVSADAK
jgi:ABC-type thiamin/hydroxymethylpyrimidine transport system permease subunit